MANLADSWSANAPALRAPPLLCDEFVVPAENRVGCHDRGQFPKGIAPERLAFDGQQSPLVVGE